MPLTPPDTTVVVDTNVFVAAGFNRASASAKIVAAVRAGDLRMAWSDATRREAERILRKIPPLSADEFLDLFRAGDRVDGVLDTSGFENVPDSEDRKFAALAVATGAILVSNDDHLLRASGGGLTVVSPAGFAAALRRRKHECR